jgi:hypothetical protein
MCPPLDARAGHGPATRHPQAWPILVSCPANILPFRVPQKRQGKAHTAGNGRPLARCATRHWRFCGAPCGRGCAGVWRCYACLKGECPSCASVPGHTPAQPRCMARYLRDTSRLLKKSPVDARQGGKRRKSAVYREYMSPGHERFEPLSNAAWRRPRVFQQPAGGIGAGAASAIAGVPPCPDTRWPGKALGDTCMRDMNAGGICRDGLYFLIVRPRRGYPRQPGAVARRHGRAVAA